MGSEAQSVDYDISMALFPAGYPHPFSPYAGAIRVKCDVTLANPGAEPIDQVTFILYRLLTVRQVAGPGGEALAFCQEIRDLEGIENLQVRVVHVSLTEPIAPGGRAKLMFFYDGPVAGQCEAMPYCKDSVNRDFALLRSDVIWYPVAAGPTRESWNRASWQNAGFTYRIRVEVPHSLIPDPVVVTAGELEAAETQEDHSVFRYSCQAPSTRIDVVIAPYATSRDAGGNVTVFSLPGDEQAVDRVLWTIAKTRELCSRWLGPVVSRKLAIAEIPDNWGSQSSPQLILQTRSGFLGGSPAPSGLPRPEWRQFLNLGHEVAHLWSVASLEPVSSRWLDEGMTHFVESLLLREVFGEDAFRWRTESFARSFNDASAEARSQPICGNEKPEYTTVLSRGKGPWVLYALSQLIGLDATLAAMKDFTQKYLGTGATPKDFVDVAASSVTVADPSGNTAAKVRELLTEWLFGTSVTVIHTDCIRASMQV